MCGFCCEEYEISIHFQNNLFCGIISNENFDNEVKIIMQIFQQMKQLIYSKNPSESPPESEFHKRLKACLSKITKVKEQNCRLKLALQKCFIMNLLCLMIYIFRNKFSNQ